MMVVMRLATLIVALLLLSACGDPQSGAPAGGRGSATPTPDVALRLMDRVRNMTAIVRRTDRIAAVQAKWGDVLSRSGVQGGNGDPNEDVWIVAVVGEVYPSFGVMEMGSSPCGTFAFGQGRSVRSKVSSWQRWHWPL